MSISDLRDRQNHDVRKQTLLIIHSSKKKPKKAITLNTILKNSKFKTQPQRHTKNQRYRISKRGDQEVRKRLYEATLSAARFNPAVKDVYSRLKEKGKPEKVARIAAARKLLLIAHAVYKSGDKYREPGD